MKIFNNNQAKNINQNQKAFKTFKNKHFTTFQILLQMDTKIQ